MQKILIVEDDKKLSKELEKFLSQNGYEISRITSFENIINDILNSKCNMVLLDINLPGNNGEYICKEVRKISEVPIVMITSVDSELDQLISLNYGADDYITKPFNILEVKARIKAIMRRSSKKEEKPVENPSIHTFGSMQVDVDSRRVFIDGKEVNLTVKEFDLLELLMDNPNKVYSREKLLNDVWGYEYLGDVRTVDVHVRRLREKIESTPSDPKYIHTKWGVGYYFQA